MKWWVIEGNRQRLDGGAMFGHAPKELWQRWIPADEKNQIPLATRCFLFKTDAGKYVLFDAGVGLFFEPKMRHRYGVTESEHILLKELAAIGLSHEDIDVVILSHLHFDHVGGLLSAYGDKERRLLFPRASYHVSQSHWERAKSPHRRDKTSFIPEIHTLLESSGRLRMIDKEGPLEEIDGAMSVTFSHGHTIGLAILEVELPEGPLALVTDLVPGMPWVHLPITLGYDRYPEKTIEEKEALYARLLPRNGRLGFAHDPSTAIAWLRQDASGRYYGVAASGPMPSDTHSEGE